MNDSLRPLNLGEILDRTLDLYRARFLVFFGIAALPAGVVVAIASASLLFFLWFGSGASALASPLLAGVLALVFFAVLLLVGFPAAVGAAALGTAALTHAAAHAYRDEDISIRAVCKLAWKHGWRYLWLYVLQSLLVFVAPMMVWNLVLLLATMAGALGVGAGGVLAGIVAIAGGIGLAVWFLMALVRLWMAFPVCVVEQTGAWEAVKRSYRLSQGARGRIFVLWLLGAVLSYLLSLALAAPLMIAIELIPGMTTPLHAELAGTLMLYIFFGAFFAVQALTRPVYAIALLLFYYDQRIRREGFDIEWLMQKAGMLPEARSAPAEADAALPRETPSQPANSAGPEAPHTERFE
jgi:hypothetical protein